MDIHAGELFSWGMWGSISALHGPKMDKRILAKMEKFFWLDGLNHLPMLGDFDLQRCPLGLVTIRHLDTFGNSWRFHIWWFCLERNPWVSLKTSSWPNSPLLGLAQVRRTFCSEKLAEDKYLRHMESCLLKLETVSCLPFWGSKSKIVCEFH